MAGIVMKLYSLGGEVKDSCKFERIYNDLLDYCTQYDSCQPRRVLMRTLGNFQKLGGILTSLITETSKVGFHTPYQIDEYEQAKFIGSQFGEILRTLIDFSL